MIEKSRTIGERASALMSSQKSVSGIASGLGQDFDGRLPSLIVQNLLSMRGKYTEINENLTEYSGFLEHAANEYEWTESELTKLMQSIGGGTGGGGTNPGGGTGGGDDGGGGTNPGDGTGGGDDGGGGGGGGETNPGGGTGGGGTNPGDGTGGGDDGGGGKTNPGDGTGGGDDGTGGGANPDPIEDGTQIPYNPIYHISLNLGQQESYAIGRAEQLRGITINWYGGAPNAQNWTGSASNLTQTGMPSIGDIIAWLFGGGSGGSNYGVVEKIDPIYDSSGGVSDYNVYYSTADSSGSSSGAS
ncbi:MAG: hypothetical protein LBQ36_03800, partial [Synergistaceae bacterium]|nr:hypothetical protein [Synergistaceae bacterium]